MPYQATTLNVSKKPDDAGFTLLIRIKNFHAFLAAKAHCYTELVEFQSTNWHIAIDSKNYASEEHPAEFLDAYIYGESNREELSFKVYLRFALNGSFNSMEEENEASNSEPLDFHFNWDNLIWEMRQSQKSMYFFYLIQNKM